MGNWFGAPDYHPEIPKRRPQPFPPKSSICVIGAGPAGIHMASLLIKQGHTVKILEKTERLGGKSHTIVDEHGVPHEMGTCYLHQGYEEIRDLVQEYNAGRMIPMGDGEDTRHVFGTDLNDKDEEGKDEPLDFGDWILANTERHTVPEALRPVLPDGLQSMSIFAAVKKYSEIHSDLFGDYKYSIPPEPKNLGDISMTFLEFLKKHDLEALIPTLIYTHTVQGYGLLDRIPAFYGLLWNNPRFVDEIVSIANQISGEPVLTMLEDGFNKLWEKMAAKHEMDIVYNVDVESVTRFEKGVNIKFSQRKDGQSMETQALYFDFVVIACPMTDAAKFVALTDEERAVVSDINWVMLATTLYEGRIPAQHTDTIERPVQFFPAPLLQANGQFHGQRISRLAVRMNQDPPAPGVERFVAYQYMLRAPESGEAPQILEQLKRDLKNKMGVTDIKVLHQDPWPYFPHFSQDGIDARLPWRLRDLQGENRTWWTGSSCCFESVLDVVRYNRMLLDMFSMKVE